MASWLRVALRPGAESPQNPAIAIAFQQPLRARRPRLLLRPGRPGIQLPRQLLAFRRGSTR
eukprot:7229613-Alexandrium_andersonii.AAC.1